MNVSGQSSDILQFYMYDNQSIKNFLGVLNFFLFGLKLCGENQSKFEQLKPNKNN